MGDSGREAPEGGDIYIYMLCVLGCSVMSDSLRPYGL